MNKRKLFKKALGSGDNFRFGEMLTLLEAFGFHLARITGSHHIFTHPDVPELINVQNYKGNTKPYQLRQFVKLVEKYDLDRGDET